MYYYPILTTFSVHHVSYVVQQIRVCGFNRFFTGRLKQPENFIFGNKDISTTHIDQLEVIFII